MRYTSLALLLLLGAVACTQDQNGGNGTKVSESFEIVVHDQKMVVDPYIGGRISSMIIKDQDLLSSISVNEDNWGSTFWPSPQNSWGWPPSAEIDKKAYKVSEENGKKVLISERDPALNYIVKKEFIGSESDTSFVVKYTIINDGEAPSKVAPWEISRVAPGGITLFPLGQGAKSGDLVALTADIDGVCWFVYDTDKIPDGVPKLFADGAEGWLAQVKDGKLMLKVFVDVPTDKIAPEEGEIELYTNPDRTYIEVEQQGAYIELSPGDSSVWEVKWIVREIPENIIVEKGSPSLVAYIRSLLKS